MGNGRWRDTDWAAYKTAHIAGKTIDQVFTSNILVDSFDPTKITLRESRDSAANPASTPIILAADVTGSMGEVADALMRDGLNTLAREIYDRNPVPDPHIMVMAVGDAEFDSAPLQVTQFEADISLADQVRQLWLERGGGPNGGESYFLPHVFAAHKIDADIWKRGKKGYLFTIGDEPFLDGVTKEEAARFLGIQLERSLTARECVALLRDKFEVFHVILEERVSLRSNYTALVDEWNNVLPQHVLRLSDHTKLAETVVAAIQIAEGEAKASVVSGWGRGTDLVIADAVRNLAAKASGTGVVRL